MFCKNNLLQNTTRRVACIWGHTAI